MSQSDPIACNLTELTAEERQRRSELETTFRSAVCGVSELADGYEIVVDGDEMPVTALRQFLDLEKRCCPFFVIDIANIDDTLTIRITGEEGVKQFIENQFELSA